VATKVADTEKRANSAGQRSVSSRKHRSKDAAPVEIARASSKPGAMPNTIVSAYAADTKLGRSHGPFGGNFSRTPSR